MSLPNAILSSPGARRGLILSVLMLLVTGCGDTSKSPEDPTIIGVPPDTAYLGVDYSYNFGAAGGDNLLNYSLSNNPSWLSLEKTTNAARPGIVLRGQPGITGGRNGEADLGLNESIRITSNDGSLLGDREFEIDVQHNTLSIDNEPITEGRAFTPEVGKDDEAVCEIPDMSVTRRVKVEHRNLVRGAEDDFSAAQRTYNSRPALLHVKLDQPSVEAVSVRFRVSQNDPFSEVIVDRTDSTKCVNSDNSGASDVDEQQPCEYAEGNRTKAIFGEDLLLNGNAERYAAEQQFPTPPDYIEFIDETDSGGTGVITFEPGKTSCFVPVWVHDDDLAESTERFKLELLEVTEGLATLDGSGADAEATFEIEDETPSVSMQDERVVVTREVPEPPADSDEPKARDEFRSVKAELDRANDTGEIMRAGVEWRNDSGGDAANVRACFPTTDDADCTETPPLVIEFDPGDKESEFFLQVKANDENGDSVVPDPLAQDRGFQLGFSEGFQFGREFAAIASDEASEVTVNEWQTDVVSDFGIQSLIGGAIGEVYAAGTDDSDNLRLRSFNRLGETAIDPARDSVDLDSTGSWPTPAGQLELGFDSRSTNTSSSPELTRYLGLGYTVGQDSAMEGQLALFRSVIKEEEDENSDALFREPPEGDQSDDLLWQYQTGEDELGAFGIRGLLVSNEGHLSVGATGVSDDPIRLVRINNNTDGDSPQPDLRWNQSETTGGTNNVVGLVSAGLAGFNAVGSTLGTVDSGDAVGGEDFFFLGVASDGSVNNRIQFGSDETDTLAVADAGSTNAWLGGSGGVEYKRLGSAEIDPDSPLEEGNAFVLVTPGDGFQVRAVRNFAGSDEELVPATVDEMSASGESVVIAGTAKDSQVPYLSRLSFDPSAGEEEDRIPVEWRISIDGAQEVLDVSFFDERKIFVAYRNSDEKTAIRLYDLHGNQLSQP